METKRITSTNEIKIGDTFIYTGKPRGTGLDIPEIGASWPIKTNLDVMYLSIEMVERGRGWEKLISE